MSDTFDYVVVGGGPAGCAVAARLAEARPDLTVALIERGPPKGGLLSDIPLGDCREYGTQVCGQLCLSNSAAEGVWAGGVDISHAGAGWVAAA